MTEYREEFSLDETVVKSVGLLNDCGFSALILTKYEDVITQLVDIYRGLHAQATHYRVHTHKLIVDSVEPFVLHGNEAQVCL